MVSAVPSESMAVRRNSSMDEKDLDQFFIDLPSDYQSRVMDSDLKKEALSILSA